MYSISRKYSVPVNDLAVLNKISAPFTLSVGQKIKVPDVLSVPKYNAPVRAAVKPEPKIESKAQSSKPTTTKVDNKKIDVKKTAPESVKKTDVKKVDATKKVDTSKKVNAKTEKVSTKTTAKNTKATVKDTKTGIKKQTSKTATKTTSGVETKKTTKRTTKTLAARSASKFSWPLRGKILSGFGSKPNGLVNDGINIAGTKGAKVMAAENGFVAYAGNEVKGMGNLIIIQHSDGFMTVYAHMDTMSVRRGATVVVGQKIGTVGQSGKVDRPQLHFEIRKGTRAYNPVNYLKK
ncbi:MAG: M23 family metallopeptidase [Alphaproteobacteria bacterium]|nr:M23 family metallopeptidase [Alphaproteobacteria bacterium]